MTHSVQALFDLIKGRRDLNLEGSVDYIISTDDLKEITFILIHQQWNFSIEFNILKSSLNNQVILIDVCKLSV